MRSMATTANKPKKLDTHGDPWSEMDIEDLTAALKFGCTIEDAAIHLVGQGQLKKSGTRLKSLD